MAEIYTISLRAEQIVMLRAYLRQVLEDPNRHGIVKMLLGGVLYDLEQLPVTEMSGMVPPDAPPMRMPVPEAVSSDEEVVIPEDQFDDLGE